MKQVSIALMLLALVCWLYPIPIAAQKTDASKIEYTTESTDYISNDIIITNNAIEKHEPAPAPTPVKVVSKPAQTHTPKKLPSRLDEANGAIQTRIRAKVVAKWGEHEWPAMHFILDHESGSNPYAKNPTSTACGIPQATPCSKMLAVIGSLDNVEGQLDWMINYVASRYKTPTGAMIFWQAHHWY